MFSPGNFFPYLVPCHFIQKLLYNIPEIQPGNSGGPIVHCNSRNVIGIVRWTSLDRTYVGGIFTQPEILSTLTSKVRQYEAGN